MKKLGITITHTDNTISTLAFNNTSELSIRTKDNNIIIRYIDKQKDCATINQNNIKTINIHANKHTINIDCNKKSKDNTNKIIKAIHSTLIELSD